MGVLALAPDPDPTPRFPGTRRADMSYGTADARVRQALIRGNHQEARDIAERATQTTPNDPDAWMWRVVLSLRDPPMVGDAAAAMRLKLLLGDDQLQDPLDESGRLYRMGWALRGLGSDDESHAAFLRAADLLEHSSVPGASGGFLEYNLACYRAMGGLHRDAAELFERAAEYGFVDIQGWWRTDPDLDPIRDQPAYERAARIMRSRSEPRPSAAPGPDADGSEPARDDPDADPPGG